MRRLHGAVCLAWIMGCGATMPPTVDASGDAADVVLDAPHDAAPTRDTTPMADAPMDTPVMRDVPVRDAQDASDASDACGDACDDAALPTCPCWAGDCPSCYCGAGVAAYATAHACTVAAATGHAGDLLGCAAGRWTVGTACASGHCDVAADGTADTCVAPAGATHHLWLAFDTSIATQRAHTEAFFHCILEHTDFNTLATTYSSGRALAFGGAATLTRACSIVRNLTATVAQDTTTFSCIEAQTGWPIANDDVIMYYPSASGCSTGRNHWSIPVSGAGHSARVEVGMAQTGTQASCLTALGMHEVYEATSEASAADCCNGANGCTATPAAYGWYTLSACGTTYTAQAVSPAAHEFDMHYCAELH